jgi:valyl-tRNA synthetase
VPLADLVDVGRERERLGGEITSLDKALTALEGRLANEKFTSKAPPELVASEREKAREWRTKLETMQGKLRELGG